MGKGVFQIKTRGVQDIGLTGNPEINFIQQVYKRHVNFAIEPIKLIPNEHVDFGKKFSVKVGNFGDLLSKMYFYFKLPPLQATSGSFAGWTNSIGHAIIEYIDIEIGHSLIDRNYGLYMEIWNELTIKPGIRSSEDDLIGKYGHVPLLTTNAEKETEYYVPLQFWFCSNLGSSLPLVALRFHDVVLKIKLRDFDGCVIYDGVSGPETVNILESNIIADYIYMDEKERDFFKKTNHKFLINQTQSVLGDSLPSSGNYIADLPFNNPVYEILFVIREINSDDNNDWFNFSIRNNVINTEVFGMLDSAKLIFDNFDRSEYLKSKILTTVNSSKFHTNTTDKHIYTFPLCAYPEKFQPSGSMNFSTVSSALLSVKLKDSIPASKLYVFAKSWNMLMIGDGLSSLEYLS